MGGSGQRETDEQEKEERGREKEPNGHGKSGAFFISMPSHQTAACVHTPRDVATKRTLQITATNNKQLFSARTRAGDEDKSLSVAAAHVLQSTPFSKLQHQSDFHIMTFFFIYIWFYLCTHGTFQTSQILVTPVALGPVRLVALKTETCSNAPPQFAPDIKAYTRI